MEDFGGLKWRRGGVLGNLGSPGRGGSRKTDWVMGGGAFSLVYQIERVRIRSYGITR